MISRSEFASLLVLTLLASPAAFAEESARLAPSNPSVPFAYKAGSQREWPILVGNLAEADRLKLEVLGPDNKVIGHGNPVSHENLTVSVPRSGKLRVVADASARASLSVRIIHSRQDEISQQVIRLLPAPPARPISYISDLVDDLIRLFWDSSQNRWRQHEAHVFNAYFRRLQCQGIARLIVWQSPLPALADPKNYPAEDWKLYRQSARAILDDPTLTKALKNKRGPKPWSWLRMMMRLRLAPSIMTSYAAAAHEQGIRLSASFRPFESGLTKYYVVPRFDAGGRFVGEFLPLASPTTMFHPNKVGFAGYAEILRRMGQPEAARPTSITFDNVPGARTLADRFRQGHRDLEIRAMPFAPIDPTSLVLVASGKAQALVPYARVRAASLKHDPPLAGWKIDATSDTSIRITGLAWPDDARFLWIGAATDAAKQQKWPAVGPTAVTSAAGHRLGRMVQYWALSGDEQAQRDTHIVGIPLSGMYRTEFQAVEASHAALIAAGNTTIEMGDHQLVIDRGARWSVEMVDFSQPFARKEALAEIDTQLRQPAYDEIFINTRSHTQLAASTGQTLKGEPRLASILDLRRSRTQYTHLGIDRAAGPRGLARSKPFRERIARGDHWEQVTTWQLNEWIGPCPDDDRALPWRFHRSRAIARGVRSLLEDLRQRYPRLRIRVVVPQGAQVERTLRAALPTMTKPEGGKYESNYYRYIWSTNNHIPAIGEGLSVVDFTGLDIEPAYLGIRFAPQPAPLGLFLDQVIEDLKNSRGSRFRGPHSVLYEAQETLRAPYSKRFTGRREEIIRKMLERDEINEVILYESADWMFYLPLHDPHRYLDTKPSS